MSMNFNLGSWLINIKIHTCKRNFKVHPIVVGCKKCDTYYIVGPREDYPKCSCNKHMKKV